MNIKQLLDQRFLLLDSWKNKLFLVVFLFIYIVVFLNVFVPFDIDDWATVPGWPHWLIFSSYAVIGALSIAFTQFLLRKWLKMEKFTLKQFLIWVFFELLFATFLLTFIYGGDSTSTGFVSDFFFTFKHTFLVVIIPYGIVLLILSVFQYNSEIIELKKETKKVKPLHDLIKFPDDKGNVKFTLPLNDLLYLESTDNYVYIFYILHDKIKKELLRNSLKNLESVFKDDPVKRCHRSYMVNLLNISLIKRSGQKTTLILNKVIDPIPVSKTYLKDFRDYLELDTPG
jgi:hypothetical protein